MKKFYIALGIAFALVASVFTVNAVINNSCDDPVEEQTVNLYDKELQNDVKSTVEYTWRKDDIKFDIFNVSSYHYDDDGNLTYEFFAQDEDGKLYTGSIDKKYVDAYLTYVNA